MAFFYFRSVFLILKNLTNRFWIFQALFQKKSKESILESRLRHKYLLKNLITFIEYAY